MRLGVVHVHVPGFGRGIDLVIELVRPGSDKLLQIVVTKVAVVKTVGSCIDRIHLVRCRPLDHDRAGYLAPWIFLPDGDIGSAIYAGLNCPLIVNLRCRKDSFMTIVIEAIKERVASHEIVRCQLRFDVRLGDDSANSDVHSLENVWDIEIEINHRHIETGVAVVFQQLVAEESVSCGEPIIESVEERDAKSPIDVISLRLIWQALEVENNL